MLSEQSKAEQAQLQGGEEVEVLRGLNREYEEVFGGMRYVCVSPSGLIRQEGKILC